MSMTREEAIKTLQWYVDDAGISWEDFTEAFDMALNALRPVSREQVGKYRGEWEDIPLNMDSSYFATKYNLRKKCTACKYVMPREWPNFKFCPACGSPMTDKAVEILVKRMEEMRNG